MDIKIDVKSLDTAIKKYSFTKEVENVFDSYYDENGRDVDFATMQTLFYLVSADKVINYSLNRYMRLTNGGIHTMTSIDFFVVSAFRVSPEVAEKRIKLDREG